MFPAVIVVVKLDVVLVRQDFNRITELYVLFPFDVGEDIPTQAAAEAMPDPHGGADRKGGRLLIVEGAQTHVCSRTRGLQGHALGYDFIQVGLGPHLLDVVFLDQSWHILQPSRGAGTGSIRQGNSRGPWPVEPIGR